MKAVTYYAIAARGRKFGMLIVEKEIGRTSRQRWTGEEYDTQPEAEREMIARNAKAVPDDGVVMICARCQISDDEPYAELRRVGEDAVCRWRYQCDRRRERAMEEEITEENSDLYRTATEAVESGLRDIAGKLRQNAKDLRAGVNGHRIANRLDKIADLIAPREDTDV